MTDNQPQPQPQPQRQQQQYYPPNPPPTIDPTTLTTEALQREIKSLGDQLRSEQEIIKVESKGGRKAIHVEIDAIRAMIGNLDSFVKDRFDLTEKQRVEQKQDNEKAVQAALLAAEKAVQAALLAQKEAVREQTAASALAISKSESSTAAQQSQQYATITAELKAVTDRLGEQGNRLTTIESKTIGQHEQRSSSMSSQSAIIALILAGIAVIGFVVTLLDGLP